MWYAYVGGGVMAMSQQEKTDYKRKFNEEKYDRVGLYLKQGENLPRQGIAVIWIKEL